MCACTLPSHGQRTLSAHCIRWASNFQPHCFHLQFFFVLSVYIVIGQVTTYAQIAIIIPSSWAGQIDRCAHSALPRQNAPGAQYTLDRNITIFIGTKSLHIYDRIQLPMRTAIVAMQKRDARIRLDFNAKQSKCRCLVQMGKGARTRSIETCLLCVYRLGRCTIWLTNFTVFA